VSIFVPLRPRHRRSQKACCDGKVRIERAEQVLLFTPALRTRTCLRLVARGSALGVRARRDLKTYGVRARRDLRDLLCARSYACAPPGITYHTRMVVLQIRTTATSTPWDVAVNTAPTISHGDW
jgi:hypothetical protein